MSQVEQVGKELCRHIVEFLLPLQTTREIKTDVFEKVDQTSREFARLLKGSEVIPRIPFKELYSAARVLEAEAQYSGNPDLVGEMAAKLHMTADLIVWGECHEDRRPGIPRIR
jgi:hypothetical protein